MNRTRWMAVLVAVAVLALGGVAYGVTGRGDGPVASSASSSTTTTKPKPKPTTTTSSTSTSTTSTTAATTTTTAAAAPASTALKQGAKGPQVAEVQRRLAELKFDPGPADGTFGLATTYAVQGFQKLNGMAPDGQVGPKVLEALANPAPITPLIPNGGANRLEVDLKRQVLMLYKGGELRLVSHVSTGSGQTYCAEGDCNNKAITPIGAFRFSWRYPGWRQSRLGKLYNPVYFTNSGVAVHGATSVPTHPASHGCVRIPMHIAEYFPSLVKKGDAVYVTDGRAIAAHPVAPTAPPPSDPPTTPGSETTTTTAPPTTTSTTSKPTTSTTSKPSTTTTTAPPTTTTTAPPTTTTTTTPPPTTPLS